MKLFEVIRTKGAVFLRYFVVASSITDAAAICEKQIKWGTIETIKLYADADKVLLQ